MGVIRVLYFAPVYRASLTQRCGECVAGGAGWEAGPRQQMRCGVRPPARRGVTTQPLTCILASYLKPMASSVLAWLALAASTRDVRRGEGRAREKDRGSRVPCAPPIFPTDCKLVKDMMRLVCLLCVLLE